MHVQAMGPTSAPHDARRQERRPPEGLVLLAGVHQHHIAVRHCSAARLTLCHTRQGEGSRNTLQYTGDMQKGALEQNQRRMQRQC